MKTSMRLLLILCLALGFVIYWQRARNHELQTEAQAAHQDADDARQAARRETEEARKTVAAAEADAATAIAAAKSETVQVRTNLADANKKIANLLELAKGDSRYLVTKTEYIQGQLVPSGQIEADTGRPILKRVNPRWLVYIQGVQTKKDYPPVEVTSAAFPQFVQGSVYDQQTINDAKQQ